MEGLNKIMEKTHASHVGNDFTLKNEFSVDHIRPKTSLLNRKLPVDFLLFGKEIQKRVLRCSCKAAKVLSTSLPFLPASTVMVPGRADCFYSQKKFAITWYHMFLKYFVL